MTRPEEQLVLFGHLGSLNQQAVEGVAIRERKRFGECDGTGANAVVKSVVPREAS